MNSNNLQDIIHSNIFDQLDAKKGIDDDLIRMKIMSYYLDYTAMY
jgi:hypothetical protein